MATKRLSPDLVRVGLALSKVSDGVQADIDLYKGLIGGTSDEQLISQYEGAIVALENARRRYLNLNYVRGV